MGQDQTVRGQTAYVVSDQVPLSPLPPLEVPVLMTVPPSRWQARTQWSYDTDSYQPIGPRVTPTASAASSTEVKTRRGFDFNPAWGSS
jgi:hypothetical protein